MLTFILIVLCLGGVVVYLMNRTSVENDPLSRPTPKIDRRCPSCSEYLPALRSDRDRHLERHIVTLPSRGAPRFTWQCDSQCEPELEWTNSYAAAMGLAQHFHKRHSILPVLP